MTTPDQTKTTMETTLGILALQLQAAAELAAQAHASMLNGEQNLAIGTISGFQESLTEIQILYGTAKAMHRYNNNPAA